MDSRDLLDNILQRFSSTSALWSKTMLSYARYLFWSLALISMVWTYGLMALRKADIQEFLAETVRFLWLSVFLLDFGQWACNCKGNYRLHAATCSKGFWN